MNCDHIFSNTFLNNVMINSDPAMKSVIIGDLSNVVDPYNFMCIDPTCHLMNKGCYT